MTAVNRPSAASRLGGQGAFFLAGNVYTLLVGLPLQIYVARTLGAEGLGTFSLIEGGIGLAAGLLTLGLAPTLVKFIPAHLERSEYACIRRLVFGGIKILLTAGTAAFLLLLLVLPVAAEAWPDIAEHRTAVILMGLLIPLSLVVFFLQQGLRGFQEIRYMVLGSSFMQLSVKAALAVVLLAMGFELVGYAVAVVVSVFCAVAWMAIGLRRRLRALPASDGADCSAARPAWFRYAGVMYSGSLLGIGSQYLDRFLLGLAGGAAPVGVLLVVKQLQQMPVIFLQMFLAVAAPMFSAAQARGDKKETEHIYHLATDWVVRLSAPLFVFFFAFADPVLRLFGDEFAQGGVHALWILLAGQAINLMYGPLGSVLNMSGLETRMLRLSVYQSLISLGGMLLLLPALGIMGAAIALSAGLVFMNVAAHLSANKALGLVWADRRYRKWAAPLATCTATAVLVQNTGPQSPGAWMLAAYVALLYVVFHGVSLAQGLHDDDREMLRQLGIRLGIVKGQSI